MDLATDDLANSISRLVVEPRKDVMVRRGRGAHPAFYVPRTVEMEKKIPLPKEEGWGEGRIGWEWKRGVPRSVAVKAKKKSSDAASGAEKDEQARLRTWK
jgi:hypothetical protein